MSPHEINDTSVSRTEIRVRRLIEPGSNSMVEFHTGATISENPCGGAQRYRLPITRPMPIATSDGSVYRQSELAYEDKVYGEDIAWVIEKSPEIRRAQTVLYNRVLGYGWMVTRDGKPLEKNLEREIHGYLENHHTKFMRTVLCTLDANGVCFIRCSLVNGRTITTVPLPGTYDAYCFYKDNGMLGYEVEYRKDKIRHTVVERGENKPVFDPTKKYRPATEHDVEKATAFYNSIVSKPEASYTSGFQYDTGNVDMMDITDDITQRYIDIVNRINVLFPRADTMSLYDMTFVIVRDAPDVDFMCKTEEGGARLASRVARIVEDVHILKQLVRDASFASGYNSRGRFAINDDPQYEIAMMKVDHSELKLAEAAFADTSQTESREGAAAYMEQARRLAILRAQADSEQFDSNRGVNVRSVTMGGRGGKGAAASSSSSASRDSGDLISEAFKYENMRNIPGRGVGPRTGAMNADVHVDKNQRIQPLNGAALNIDVEAFRIALHESIANEFGVPLSAISTARSQSHVTSSSTIFQNQTLEDTINNLVREIKNITGFILNLLHRKTQQFTRPTSEFIQVSEPANNLYTTINDRVITRKQTRSGNVSVSTNAFGGGGGGGGVLENLFQMGVNATGLTSSSQTAIVSGKEINARDQHHRHRHRKRNRESAGVDIRGHIMYAPASGGNGGKIRAVGNDDISDNDDNTDARPAPIQPTIGKIDETVVEQSEGTIVAYPTPRPIIPIETVVAMRDNGLINHATAALLCTSILGIDSSMAKLDEPIWMSDDFIRDAAIGPPPTAPSTSAAKIGSAKPSAAKNKKPSVTKSSKSSKSTKPDQVVRDISKSVGLLKSMP